MEIQNGLFTEKEIKSSNLQSLPAHSFWHQLLPHTTANVAYKRKHLYADYTFRVFEPMPIMTGRTAASRHGVRVV